MKIDVRPLTKERWPDLVELFERPGASIARGCWCMYYRRSGEHVPPAGLARSQWNKRDLKALVDRGVVPGLLGYEGGRPVGWISLGARGDYAKLARSPVMKPVDDKPVWSIVCFFVDAQARHHGVADSLLAAAIAWAHEQGATLLEAYPWDQAARKSDDSLWFGAKPMFDRVGFVEVARRKPARPVMRRSLRAKKATP